jgi:hypothetical protein
LKYIINARQGSLQIKNCYFIESILEFLRKQQSWFCHLDDDNYLNVKRLYEVLKDYNPNEDWYLGRISTSNPVDCEYKNVLACLLTLCC